MTNVSKVMFIAAASFAFTGTALADDPAAGGDATGAPATGAPPPAAAPTPAPMAGGKGSKTIGADVVGVLPLGDYAKSTSFGIGAMGRFEFGINDMIALTARVGYIYHLGTPTDTSIYFIPILVGGTYKIGTSGLFAEAEVGITHIGASATVMGMDFSSSDDKFAFDVGAGYQKEKIKARVSFYMPGSQDNGTSSTTLFGIMASVGFDFVSM
jgi:hypothetical protein